MRKVLLDYRLHSLLGFFFVTAGFLCMGLQWMWGDGQSRWLQITSLVLFGIAIALNGSAAIRATSALQQLDDYERKLQAQQSSQQPPGIKKL